MSSGVIRDFAGPYYVSVSLLHWSDFCEVEIDTQKIQNISNFRKTAWLLENPQSKKSRYIIYGFINEPLEMKTRWKVEHS